MTTTDKKLSDDFWLKEFSYVEPHNDLLFILQMARYELRQAIIINKAGGTTRTFKEHFEIYYKKYNTSWKGHIPWNSRHLPKYGVGLRAVDISSNGVSGKELAKLFQDIADMYHINIGLGVGINWIHIDVDRKESVVWYYDD